MSNRLSPLHPTIPVHRLAGDLREVKSFANPEQLFAA